MDKPADYSAGAGARATPSLVKQLLRAEQKHQTGNSSRQQKQSELQQSPTYSQELINANLCKLSDGLSAFQRCLGEEEKQQLKCPHRPEPELFRIELKSPPRPEPKSFRIELKSSPPRSSSEVKILCETMNSHGLRKYMIRRLSCLKTLQQKVPKALQLSPNPARLILEAIGMFYTLGSNTYVEGSPLITERRALVLLLECFLRMIGEGEDEGSSVEIENGEKEEAGQAALAWYRRLNFEGGILKAQEIDARGLLLFIGCFGIPQAFRNEDIKDLLHQSYIKMISSSLRRSSVLMAKIPEIIEGMLNQNMVVDAVYFTFCFGLEDRFNPQRLLTSFLHESEVSLCNKIQTFEQNKGSKDSALQEIIGAKRRYLGTLKSVIQCLGRNNIDHSKFLSEWQIGEKVIGLEKEIAQFRKNLKDEQRMEQKRKNDETEWLNNKEVKHSHFPNPWTPQQRVVNHVDRSNTLLESDRTAGHFYGHSVYPSVYHGPVAGSIHENIVGSLAGPMGGVAMVVPGAGISAGTDVVLSRVDGSLRDATVYDRLPSHRYAYRSPSYLEGPNTITGDAYSRPPPYMENSMGLSNTTPGDVNRPPPYSQGSAGLPNTITGDFYRPPPHLGGSMRLSNTIPPPYQLAATGPTTEPYRSSGSQAVDAVPSGAIAHPSSSLYWQR
ncbi:FRIGIDA-like protein 4a [Solanum stenotomum]|uniref:FRIGIDA-like protein 4a n=1 Tax=Solanum stenotomum TaxID=172797 RepID=UPI0020D04C9B|nr:FRIGIDA-like protein 4a [Solanum stenotomum]